MRGDEVCLRFGGPLAVVALTATICALCSWLVYPKLLRSEQDGLEGAAAVLQPLQLTCAALALFFLWLTNSVDPGLVTEAMAPAELEGEWEEGYQPPADRARGLARRAANGGVRAGSACSLLSSHV